MRDFIQLFMNDYGYIDGSTYWAFVLCYFFLAFVASTLIGQGIGLGISFINGRINQETEYDYSDVVLNVSMMVMLASVIYFAFFMEKGLNLTNKYATVNQKQNLYRCIEDYKVQYPSYVINSDNITRVLQFCDDSRAIENIKSK